jgi:hypothetical protein
MAYGGTAGRMGRMGRQPNDPPGPHALTGLQHSKTNRAYSYDANGNMTVIDGLRCTWDFKDRLVAVEDDTMRAEYRYDFSGRRVIKKVTWKKEEPNSSGGGSAPAPALKSKTTSALYPGKHFEVREYDQPTKYVFNGSTRIARVTGSLSVSTRIQRFRLHAGWSLLSLALDEARFESAPEVSAIYRWNPATSAWEAADSDHQHQPCFDRHLSPAH